MSQMLASTARNDATIVERPREGDAIGIALRKIYVREAGLPDDLAMLLRQLGGANEARATTLL